VRLIAGCCAHAVYGTASNKWPATGDRPSSSRVWQRALFRQGRRSGRCRFTESTGILPVFPWRASARWCSSAASCRRVAAAASRSHAGRSGSRLPTCCRDTADERGGACIRERATEASEAWRAKRSGRAVNGGHEGRRERPASGCGHPRAAAHPPGFVKRPAQTSSRTGRSRLPTFTSVVERCAAYSLTPLRSHRPGCPAASPRSNTSWRRDC